MSCEPYINPEWSELTLSIRSAFRDYGQEWPPFVWNAVDDAIGKSVAQVLTLTLTEGQTTATPLNSSSTPILIGKEIFLAFRPTSIDSSLTLNSTTGAITIGEPGQEGQVLTILYRKKTDE